MALKHIVIGGIKDIETFVPWIEKGMAVSNRQKSVCWTEYGIVKNVATIVCCWSSEEDFDDFWEWFRMDDQIDNQFEWQCQHKIQIDQTECN